MDIIQSTVAPGDCAWCVASPDPRFACSECGFVFGSDSAAPEKPVLVLVCNPSRAGNMDCPCCHAHNDHYLPMMFRVRRFMPGQIMTLQAEMPCVWLTKATPAEVAEYFIKDVQPRLGMFDLDDDDPDDDLDDLDDLENLDEIHIPGRRLAEGEAQ